MAHLYLLIALTGSLTVTACSAVPTFDPMSRFDPTSLVGPDVEGTAEVHGQAFLRSPQGEVKKGAGSEVLLIPENGWTREWFENVVRDGKRPSDPNYFANVGDYARRVRGDADGKFTFTKVPAGRWFVTCLITWQETEYLQTVDWNMRPWRYAAAGRGRGQPYAYYPWSNQVWERQETVGGFAHARIALKEGERLERLVVTR